MARFADAGPRQPPDPWTAACQAEFREALRELTRWAGYKSLQQLEAGAIRRGTRMPVSTANGAFNNDRLPTAEFVERVARACGVDFQPWLAARDVLADRPYLRDAIPEPVAEQSVTCPYPGLMAFAPDQAQWFFGREEVTADLLDLLADPPGPLLVSGPSGVGKSSLLRAGLPEALERGRLPSSSEWTCVTITPAAHPLERLQGEPDVLVVDQFEEVFTLCQDEGERRRFIEALCARRRVVLGMRADFLGHCASYPGLVEALRHGQVLLGPMTEQQLRAAVEKPAAAVGLVLQAGLSDVILGELGGDQPGVLPLLAHTLMATWRHREGRVLTIDGYRLTGGVTGAIAKTAERAYRQLGPDHQEAARKVLLRMIQLGDGTADTRRQLDRARLGEEPAVLDTLIDARLVTADESTVELAHEAVLQAWPRLRQWIEADRAWLLAEQRLVAAADAWDRDGRHDSDLYRGHRLAAVLERADGTPPAATEFVRASVKREHAEQRAAARRSRRLRQLVAVLSGLVLIAGTMTAITVVSRRDAAAQRDAVLSRQVAKTAIALRASDPDLAGQLALAAYDIAQTAEARGAVMTTLVYLDPTRSTDTSSDGPILTVAFSNDGSYLVSASRDGFARVWPVGDPPSLAAAPFKLARHPDQVRAAVFDPVGRFLATAGLDGHVRLWPRTGLSPGAAPTYVVDGSKWTVELLAFDDQATVLVSGARQTANVQLWELDRVSEGKPAAEFGGHPRGVIAVAISRSGRLLATSSQDSLVKLWDITDRRNPKLFSEQNHNAGPVHALAFDSRERILATGNEDATVSIVDVSDPRNPRLLSSLGGHEGSVYGVAFDPDGRRLATATTDTVARIWDITDPREPVSWAEPLMSDSDSVYSVAFHPDGHTLVSGSYGQAIRLWETDPDRAAARICRLTTPAISRTQWTKHFLDRPYEPPCADRRIAASVAPAAIPGSSLLTAVHSGKCLAPRTAESKPDAPVQQFRCKGLAAAHWTFANGQIRNTTTGMCLDAREVAVVQRPCSDQIWDLRTHAKPDGLTEGQFVHRPTGECLDISQGITLDGGYAIRWKCSGDPNQLFRVADTALRQ